MSGFLYILKSAKNTFYVGSTDNISRRVRQHECGHTRTTRNRTIHELVFVQEYSSLKEARAIERKIKSWKRKDYIEKIVNDGYIKHIVSPRRSMDRTRDCGSCN